MAMDCIEAAAAVRAVLRLTGPGHLLRGRLEGPSGGLLVGTLVVLLEQQEVRAEIAKALEHGIEKAALIYRGLATLPGDGMKELTDKSKDLLHLLLSARCEVDW